ncbi:MAG: ATP-binding cassette domain-containing protein, partial [Rhodobacteraceae bacterium]|nr:ATP-binding cassette domain-containing protein [Paracoccaceae bacterium]
MEKQGLLSIKGLRIQGRSGDAWHDIVKGVDLTLHRGEVLIGFRYPHQVSGGQLQRAMTAMAMACRPDLIIFDEPTTALDVTTQIEVLSAIRDIVRQFGTAAIYITHDLAVVAQMADRIKVLLRGNEVEEADTRSMLAAPREHYTRSLWAVRSFARTEQPTATGTPVVSVRNV